MSNWQPSADPKTLALRARVLRRIREFFGQRSVVEVSTPLITPAGVTDAQIESVALSGKGYLRTSPEYFHKRLLAAGHGDLFELGPVFRDGELGRHHQQEFMLLEWYRVGWHWRQLAEETADLIAFCLARDDMTVEWLSWQDCFCHYIGIDPFDADQLTLLDVAENAPPDCDRDMLLDMLFATRIQPRFKQGTVTIVHGYPASQAALAQISPDDSRLAQRFEVFLGNIELANGYQELADAAEQLARFKADNVRRRKLGRPEMPLDTELLSALEAGLPRCAGVALGVDRLIMAVAEAPDLAAVIAFPQVPD